MCGCRATGKHTDRGNRTRSLNWTPGVQVPPLEPPFTSSASGEVGGEKTEWERREANPRPPGARAAGQRAGLALGPKMAQKIVNDGGNGLSCYCVRPDQPDHSRHMITTHPTPAARHWRVTSGQLVTNPSPPEYNVQW